MCNLYGKISWMEENGRQTVVVMAIDTNRDRLGHEESGPRIKDKTSAKQQAAWYQKKNIIIIIIIIIIIVIIIRDEEMNLAA